MSLCSYLFLFPPSRIIDLRPFNPSPSLTSRGQVQASVILTILFLFSRTMSRSTTFPSSQWASILSKFDPGNVQVLVASVPIYGHVEKLRVVAADLVQRGYQVSFITGSVFRESVEKIGARFVALEGTADFDSSNMSKLWPERELLPPAPNNYVGI